jgi:surfactin synthase thioesterase subunit
MDDDKTDEEEAAEWKEECRDNLREAVIDANHSGWTFQEIEDVVRAALKDLEASLEDGGFLEVRATK